MINMTEFNRQRNLLNIADGIKKMKTLQRNVNTHLQMVMCEYSKNQPIGKVLGRLEKLSERLERGSNG